MKNQDTLSHAEHYKPKPKIGLSKEEKPTLIGCLEQSDYDVIAITILEVTRHYMSYEVCQ